MKISVCVGGGLFFIQKSFLSLEGLNNIFYSTVISAIEGRHYVYIHFFASKNMKDGDGIYLYLHAKNICEGIFYIYFLSHAKNMRVCVCIFFIYFFPHTKNMRVVVHFLCLFFPQVGWGWGVH